MLRSLPVLLETPPRARGEEPPLIARKAVKWETPPCAWGRPAYVVFGGVCHGNTPTCVGKTWRTAWPRHMSWKHPHVRGEDTLYDTLSCVNMETPPRAWGRPAENEKLRRCHGNTPTCVGKTKWPCYRYRQWRKHPHVRGEDPVPCGQCLHCRRNTPTCVGKTLRIY